MRLFNFWGRFLRKSRPVLTFAITLAVIASVSTVAIAQVPIQTRDNGAPVGDNQNSQTAGAGGPVLLQDVHLIEKLARFNRERIPERVVHARGTGAHGEFVSTANLSNITMAAPFQSRGKKTPVFVRFSSVINSKGSPETLRDPRGFSTKFYTDQGNWDLVGNNLPVFFIRDAIKFPDMVHSLKPSPITNRQDPNRFFDFFSHVPESTHMLSQVYSDKGTPRSYREMDGNGVHAYKLVNRDGDFQYVKFRWKSLQGEHNLTAQEAKAMQADDFNHYTADLYAEVGRGNAPKWDLYIQTLKLEDLDKFDFNPLDATKIWPTDLVPERKVGTMTLNRMPTNFFQETEQSAFAPSNIIPGIEPSEDRLLQGRLFSYADTHRHRLGANHMMLPINRPRVDVVNGNQDGPANIASSSSDVNFEPNRQQTFAARDEFRSSQLPIAGVTQNVPIEKTLNFAQAGDFYRGLNATDKAHLVSNLAADLGVVEDTGVRTEMTAFFYKADADYGTKLAEAVKVDLNAVKQRASQLSE
ncbi:MAG: catalase [Cyanobacteria bacterium P01_H01_bin.21]